MNDAALNALRYPVGTFEAPAQVTDAQKAQWLDEIAAFPAQLRRETASLSEAQLETPYRPGGWTVRQVIHHCADSHMNAFIRFKLALTEDAPVIKPYFEDRWASLGDYAATPVHVSLDLLDALHARWTHLLRSMTPADWKRSYVHPEYGKTYVLDHVLGLYAWHGRHHLAHIMSLKAAQGW